MPPDRKTRRFLHARFAPMNMSEYGQQLFERFKQRGPFEKSLPAYEQETDVSEEDYQGSCSGEDVIYTDQRTTAESDDQVSAFRRKCHIPVQNRSNPITALTCCQKAWNVVDSAQHRRCIRCHRIFTRSDIFYLDEKKETFCTICWMYQITFATPREKHPFTVRCNLCAKPLPHPLATDVVALNFVHPECLQRHASI